jgi:non-ribosomal peptide synthetase component F
MSDFSHRVTNLPPEQQAIRDKCFHPSGTFVEFSKEDVETSIPALFEKIVRKHANLLGGENGGRIADYDELNRYANRIAHAIFDRRGLGSEPIALFFENSVDLIANFSGPAD